MQGTRSDAIPINLTVTTPVGPTGFTFQLGDRTMGLCRNVTGHFRAPFVLSYTGVFESRRAGRKKSDDWKRRAADPRTFELTTILIPTRPGWSRIITLGAPTKRQRRRVALERKRQRSAEEGLVKQEKGKAPRKGGQKRVSLMQRLFTSLPTWVSHQFSNRFLDSDLAFLHFQEQERQRRNAAGMAPYFMPAPADRTVTALRKWIETYAHIPGPLPPLITDRKALFDRWSQHTEQCRHCRNALKGMQKIRKRTYATMALSVLFVGKSMLARLLIVVCLAILRLVATIEPSFKDGGFNHYEND